MTSSTADIKEHPSLSSLGLSECYGWLVREETDHDESSRTKLSSVQVLVHWKCLGALSNFLPSAQAPERKVPRAERSTTGLHVCRVWTCLLMAEAACTHTNFTLQLGLDPHWIFEVTSLNQSAAFHTEMLRSAQRIIYLFPKYTEHFIT